MSSRDLAAIALAELRRESQDIYNRIHSIAEDAEFVKQVHQHFRDLPLLPNMRCGAWYVDPDINASQHAYFKSTDGHTNNWSFNLRRPNLHILPLIAQHRGLILVDSTRAGKRMPDALSKTIPIWCSVINRALLLKCRPSSFDGWDTAIYTPPGVVSVQERHQIEKKLDEWGCRTGCTATIASFYEIPGLQRPLRPVWITPATSTYPDLSSDALSFHPVVCLSASKQVADGLERRTAGFTYIQGSGDDHEFFFQGLTPTVFWRNRDQILKETRSALPDLVPHTELLL
ncbi:tRNA A64-2'-O-ribosylphosphate transferase [Pisolithus croceorrhizus]|nr:tRNA A64-2'-O-ribosylphosphate transferase [Pisolithus croceorrhizus]